MRALDTISTLTFTSRAHYSFICSFGQEFLVQSKPTTLYVPIFFGVSLLFFLFHRDWHAMLFVVFSCCCCCARSQSRTPWVSVRRPSVMNDDWKGAQHLVLDRRQRSVRNQQKNIWVHAECTRFLVLLPWSHKNKELGLGLSPLPWPSYRPAPRGAVCIVRLRSAESLATVSSVLLWISFRRKPGRPFSSCTHFHVRAVHRGQKKKKRNIYFCLVISSVRSDPAVLFTLVGYV